jgi:hypothetical protein
MTVLQATIVESVIFWIGTVSHVVHACSKPTGEQTRREYIAVSLYQNKKLLKFKVKTIHLLHSFIDPATHTVSNDGGG